jgi:4-methylaminobutanoate oxidase (formaldehyde-forming)
VTSRYACFALWGPNARTILQPLTDTDLSNIEWPYLRARELNVGAAPCLGLRVTFVGELGWELYCPTEYGAGLWRALWLAGQEHGLTAGGYRAIDSLRMEKGYRVWAADITPDETPYEAGLGFCVRAGGGFIGAPALGVGVDVSGEAGDAAGPPPPRRRLRCLALEDPRSVALGNEPVRVDGEIVGRVTSGGYGYTVERSIAYAYLPVEVALGTPVDVDIFGKWTAGVVAREPLYDPKSERVRS